MAVYYERLKILWDELALIGDLVLLYAEDVALLGRSEERQRMIKFFIGLNDTDCFVRTNILMRQPLPNLYVAYSILLQEENQRHL